MEISGRGSKCLLACLSDCQIVGGGGGYGSFPSLTAFEFGVERKGRRGRHCMPGFRSP